MTLGKLLCLPQALTPHLENENSNRIYEIYMIIKWVSDNEVLSEAVGKSNAPPKINDNFDEAKVE